ncbi:hypothetical protein H4S02_009042 [Coemansia sp. RSA 2611]|nr:hypothetical protein H4S01_005626 [Coemansia sp. RSA 2610]KAJ2372903.1 hypothetical protein H4S02_009042 [Coemansia sp. RSA 2611]KAJ2739134.1 hypothetical protein H4R23_000677 [Coemansia sp. Cherry 401B]
MPRKQGPGTRSRPRTARRVSELERDVSALSVDAKDEQVDAEDGERMQTRQDTRPERKQALQRLMAAIREGDFDDDLNADDSAPMTRARERRGKLRRRREALAERANDSDSDYVQKMDEEEDEAEAEDEDVEDELPESASNENDEQLVKTEKRLILKFKTARRSSDSADASEEGPKLEDVDWSEFDLETINEILARREALRKKRRQQELRKLGVSDDGEVTTAKLKKSSLAPPPLQLDKVQRELPLVEEDDEEGAIAEDTGRQAYEAMDVDAEEPEFSDLFEDVNEVVPQTPGTSLHLPPRASAMSEELLAADHLGLRHGRPHPALIRNMADMQPDKDMRIVLQYELRSEETLLKDLRAEIADKLLKLQAEEKLLRMVVKRDFELPEESAEEPDRFAFEPEVEEPAAMPMEEEGEDAGSESDGSLSGMSSSSSDDDAQNDELTRGALSQMLRTYLPSGEMDGLGPDS